MSLPEFSIDRPVATLMLLLSLVVLGVVAIGRIPLDFMPQVDEPGVTVRVPFPGSHPLESLREVALPLEEELAAIPGVRSVRSTSGPGNAEVSVEFGWGDDLDLKKMEVREAVERARARLPAGVGRVLVESWTDGPAGGAVLLGRISADRDLSESWGLLDRRIRRPLERVKGVARVHLYGVEPQEVRIDLDLAALERHGVGPQEVRSAVDAANLDLDLGAVRGDVLRYDVRSIARFRDLDAIRGLSVGGRGARLRDVAQVSLTQPRLPYSRHLDRRFAIGIDVFKEPAANTVDTADRVMERVGEIERDPELAGIRLLVWNNSGEEIRRSLGGLLEAGLYGGVLAIGVLYVFLRRLRTTLIVATAIPFSMVVTCGAMYLLGAEFNVLTMLGLMLGVGMLVDNAVVVIENIHRLEGEGMAPGLAARIGARDVTLAVVASTATTLIVWSWLLVTERGPMVIYIGQVALTIGLAVVCSLLISLTFIPLAAARFAPRKEVRAGPVMRRLVPGYRALLAWTFRHRGATLLGLFVLAASAVWPIVRIEKTGEPKFQERAVALIYRVHDPATKEVVETYVDQVETWLESKKSTLGYEHVYSVFEDNQGGTTQVYLPRERATEEEIARLRGALETDLPVIPGVKIEIGDREWWRGGGGDAGRRRVPVALHGEDPEFLEDLAARVEERLRRIPGVVDVLGPSVEGQKEIRLRVRSEEARALGLSPRDIAEAVAFAFRGQHLRRFQQGDEEFELVLGLPQQARPGLTTLADLPVPTPEGGSVPLGAISEFVVARTSPAIEREDRRTTTWVNVEFDPSMTTEQAQALVQEAMRGFVLPNGYAWSWGEWGRDRDEGLGIMLQGVLLSLLVVILLMAAIFESFTQPLAIVITLPLAFFGAFWALWLRGESLEAVAFMGIIILIGIVVNNGIVMVDHVNRLRRQGRERVDALIEGCGDRLRPVLMTAITTFFGLLPLAFSGFTVAGAYVDSLAVAVAGGLATSTLFTLVALPVWYTAVEDVGALFVRILPRRPAPRAPDLIDARIAAPIEGPIDAGIESIRS